MNRTYYIRHPDKGIFFADDNQCNAPKHCLMSKELAVAMLAEMQAYPDTRGAEIGQFDDELIGLGEFKPFVTGD